MSAIDYETQRPRGHRGLLGRLPPGVFTLCVVLAYLLFYVWIFTETPAEAGVEAAARQVTEWLSPRRQP